MDPNLALYCEELLTESEQLLGEMHDDLMQMQIYERRRNECYGQIEQITEEEKIEQTQEERESVPAGNDNEGTREATGELPAEQFPIPAGALYCEELLTESGQLLGEMHDDLMKIQMYDRRRNGELLTESEQLLGEMHDELLQVQMYEKRRNECYGQIEQITEEEKIELIQEERESVPAGNDDEGTEGTREANGEIPAEQLPIPPGNEQRSDVQEEKAEGEPEKETKSAPAGKMKRLRRFLRRVFCCLRKQDDTTEK